MTHQTSTGPIEAQTWPARLTAHVVDANGGQPRLHGYDVQADLARHHSFLEIVLAALLGDVPDAETSHAIGVALAFLAPVSIGDAPVHAAVLSRLCGARPSGVTAVAATALAEQARALFDEHEQLVPQMLAGSDGVAQRFPSRDDAERAAVARFRDALGTYAVRVPVLAFDVRLDTALLATLLTCGLRTRDQIETLVTMARLPLACAEAHAWKAGDFRAYPMDLPRFEYTP